MFESGSWKICCMFPTLPIYADLCWDRVWWNSWHVIFASLDDVQHVVASAVHSFPAIQHIQLSYILMTCHHLKTQFFLGSIRNMTPCCWKLGRSWFKTFQNAAFQSPISFEPMEIITFFQEVDRPDRALVSISTYGNLYAYKYTTWYMFVLHVQCTCIYSKKTTI